MKAADGEPSAWGEALVRFWLVLILSCVVAGTVCAAPPTVDHVFPAGGRRGTTVKVTVTGKFDSKTKVSCSRGDLKLAFEAKSRKLTITIPKDAQPGLCWLRLHNAEGASSAKAFLIGTLPEIAEREPNNRLDQSQVLKNSSIVNGVLAKSGDVDTFGIALKAGQTLVAAMTANRTLGSPMDGVLQIVSKRGFVLAQNDDDRGLDPLVAFRAPRDDVYHVRCFAFPATPNSSVRLSGSATYIYRLTVTTGAYLDHTMPLAVSPGPPTNRDPAWLEHPPGTQDTGSPRQQNGFDVESRPWPIGEYRRRLWSFSTRPGMEGRGGVSTKPQAVKSVMTVSGHVGVAREVDRYSLSAKKGDRLRLRVEARSLGSPLDPVLRLRDAKGTVVARAETRSSTAIDENLSYRAPTSGRYVLEVTDLHRRGGWRYFYRLTIGERPVESLRVAADRFTSAAGKPLVIPVTFAGAADPDKLAFQILGLPKGVTVNVSAGRKKSARRGSPPTATVKLTLTGKSVGEFQGPIRIIATVKGGTPLQYPAESAVAGTGVTTSDLWLTVTRKAPGKKE